MSRPNILLILTDRTALPPDAAYEPVSPAGHGIGPELHRTLEAWLERQRA